MNFRSRPIAALAATLADLWGRVTTTLPRTWGRKRGTYPAELTPDQVTWLREQAEDRRRQWASQQRLKGE